MNFKCLLGSLRASYPSQGARCAFWAPSGVLTPSSSVSSARSIFTCPSAAFAANPQARVLLRSFLPSTALVVREVTGPRLVSLPSYIPVVFPLSFAKSCTTVYTNMEVKAVTLITTMPRVSLQVPPSINDPGHLLADSIQTV